MSLNKIQAELKVPKGNFNSFGKYKYRSTDDIAEALKPLLLKYNATLVLTDDIVIVGQTEYLKSIAKFKCGDESFEVSGFAKTGEHKGMSSEQTTGTASSYARKYALNGLFLIDETEQDPDSQKQAVHPQHGLKTIQSLITPEIESWIRLWRQQGAKDNDVIRMLVDNNKMQLSDSDKAKAVSIK